MKLFEELDLENKRVFLRVDFNVPLTKEEPRRITDLTRIEAELPTIKKCLEKGAKLIIASHLGRPKGKPEAKYSLEPVAAKLAEILNQDVILTDAPVSDAALGLSKTLLKGQVMMLENLRFHPGEEAGDEDFAKQLANMAEVYINDAFGLVHRNHASNYTLPKLMAQKGVGYLINTEMKHLSRLVNEPVKPYVAIIGGAKISDKLELLLSLVKKVDHLIIGGAMAYTIMAAQGKNVGKSLCEPDAFSNARDLVEKARAFKTQIHLPLDHGVVMAFDKPETLQYVENLGPEHIAIDVGPKSIEAYQKVLANAKTIFWNGPLGVTEVPAYAKGTVAIAQTLAQLNCFRVVGGGDSVAVINQYELAGSFDWISTGGGASLKVIEGVELKPLQVLG